METFSFTSWWRLRVFRTFGQTVKTLNACISGVLYFFFNSTPLKTPFDRLLNYLKLPVWCCSLLSKFQCFKVRTDVEMVKFQGLNFFSKTLNACNSVDFWTFWALPPLKLILMKSSLIFWSLLCHFVVFQVAYRGI